LAATIDAAEWNIDPAHTPTSLLVQFRGDAQYAGSLRAHSVGQLTMSQWAIAPGFRQVELAPGVALEEALDAFEDDPHVVFAEPDYRVRLNATIPNDPGFASDQWGLHNTGQIFGLPGRDIRAPAAWEVTTGSPGVVVAVIDTGIDYGHPDLAPNMWTNDGEIPGNGLDDDKNGYIDDYHGYDFVNGDGDPMDDYFHGTHVAGTIAAVMNNGIGGAGVAPNSRLMALKFLDATGGGLTSDAISSLNYAVANGASISNNSWGGGPFSQAFKTAIERANAAGHIFVASAGNYGNNNDGDPFYPSSYDVPNVISVAATDAGDFIAYFSNYGKTSVDVGAPGVDIYSTLPTASTNGMVMNGLFPNYGTLSGTSMAAPHVAGVLALLRSAGGGSPQDLIAKVKSTVDRSPSLTTRTVSGGRVNAAAALGVSLPQDDFPHVDSSDPSGVLSGVVDHVRFAFSEPIDPASFDFDDIVAFLGPEGPLSILSIEPSPDGDRHFTVTFDPQSAPGDYYLTIGPHIADLAGKELDQDDDKQGGIEGLDEYTAHFRISESAVFRYSSPNVPIEIRGFDPFISYLTIDDDIPIADLNVHLNLAFPRAGNLHIYLVSPAGTVVNLSYRNGGNESSFIDTVFDDEADLSLPLSGPPFSGPHQPDELLSLLDGENARGTWQLVIQNVSEISNRGTLNSWSLEIIPGESSGGGGEINDPPTPQNDIFTTVQDEPLVIDIAELLSNDDDPNDHQLTLVSVANPIGGTVQFNADATITFTPDSGSLAPGSFQYLVSDGLDSAIATVTIVIKPRFNLHNGYDVNADGFISPLDPLHVINYLNAYGSAPIIGLGLTANVKLYYDVIADNVIAPNDALAVINYINANPPNRKGGPQAVVDNQSSTAASAARLDAASVDLLLAATNLEPAPVTTRRLTRRT
jgi:subtilisin family serine protease/subtilisin-like proprotein convertase family protein